VPKCLACPIIQTEILRPDAEAISITISPRTYFAPHEGSFGSPASLADPAHLTTHRSPRRNLRQAGAAPDRAISHYAFRESIPQCSNSALHQSADRPESGAPNVAVELEPSSCVG
jgi:hypothetical protein